MQELRKGGVPAHAVVDAFLAIKIKGAKVLVKVLVLS